MCSSYYIEDAQYSNHTTTSLILKTDISQKGRNRQRPNTTHDICHVKNRIDRTSLHHRNGLHWAHRGM